MPVRSGRCVAAAALVIASLSARARGHGMIPRDAPIERIVQNLKARIAEHPDDAEAYYALGRAHALVFEYKNRNVKVWALGGGPEQPAPDGWQKRLADQGEAAAPSAEELERHLVEAISNLNVAIERDPAQAKYHLALASILEAGESMMERVEVHPLPAREVPEAENRWYEDAVGRLGTDPDALEEMRRSLRGHAWDTERPTIRDRVVPALRKAAGGEDAKRAALARELLAEDWREQMTEGYFRALCLALPVNGKADEKPLWGSMEDWVAYEAACDYVRVVEARGVRPDERIRMGVAKAAVRGFDNLPRPGGITPIVVRLDGAGPLSSWLDPGIESGFDLDGAGRGLRWPWLKPDTALLVWDPDRTGCITSGRQLFGSVTWWLFFRHGYEALDALDDDRDGRVAGVELRGLSLWFDRDSDGVSDPGEVRPVGEFGIRGLSTRVTGTEDGSPMSAEGVWFDDGRVLPTYDWVVDAAVRGSPTSSPAHNVAAVMVLAGVVMGRRRG